MNRNTVFARSLGVSLGCAIPVFLIGVPLVFLAMDGFKVSEDSPLLFFAGIAMYVVYWPIQIMLSLCHLIIT